MRGFLEALAADLRPTGVRPRRGQTRRLPPVRGSDGRFGAPALTGSRPVSLPLRPAGRTDRSRTACRNPAVLLRANPPSPDGLVFVHHSVEALGQPRMPPGAGMGRRTTAPGVALGRIGAAGQQHLDHRLVPGGGGCHQRRDPARRAGRAVLLGAAATRHQRPDQGRVAGPRCGEQPACQFGVNRYRPPRTAAVGPTRSGLPTGGALNRNSPCARVTFVNHQAMATAGLRPRPGTDRACGPEGASSPLLRAR